MTRDNVAIGRRSKRKGKVHEREVAVEFRKAMPGADVKRGIGQARRGGEVADVDAPAFWIEAKHRRRPNIPQALAQAERDRGDRNLWPLAVTKADGEKQIASMYLEDFLALVKQWWSGA